jgi:Flp pilus assembly protein TadB
MLVVGVRAGGNLLPRPAACELALKGYHVGWARAGLAQLKAASNKIGRGPSVRNAFNRLKQKLTETFGTLNKSNQILIIAVCAILVLYLLLWLVDKLFVYFLAKSYVSEIAEVFNLRVQTHNQ